MPNKNPYEYNHLFIHFYNVDLKILATTVATTENKQLGFPRESAV